MNKKAIPGYLSRIEFWIFIFFIIRLFHITYPPVETAHSWRQSDVLMIARNFTEVSGDISLPLTLVSENSNFKVHKL
jgi:hypothetical protein